MAEEMVAEMIDKMVREIAAEINDTMVGNILMS